MRAYRVRYQYSEPLLAAPSQSHRAHFSPSSIPGSMRRIIVPLVVAESRIRVKDVNFARRASECRGMRSSADTDSPLVAAPPTCDGRAAGSRFTPSGACGVRVGDLPGRSLRVAVRPVQLDVDCVFEPCLERFKRVGRPDHGESSSVYRQQPDGEVRSRPTLRPRSTSPLLEEHG